MKRIVLLLICVFALSCVQIQAQTTGGRKDKGFKTIKTKAGRSVLPSYRSKKHLNLLKGRYNAPFMSNSYSYCEDILNSKRKRNGNNDKFDRITFFDLNYAYSMDPQHSFGVTFGQVGRFGYYISAMTGLNYAALNADMECDQNGYVDGEMQYYSGQTTNSRYSVICGLMFRINEPLALKVGAGYGERALAWRTGDEYWIRNTYYCSSGVELNAGLQVFIDKFNLSFDFISNSFKTAEFKIGMGFNIK